VPTIIEPIIEEAPARADYVDSGFKAIDEHSFIISEADLTILSVYIVALKNRSANGWDYVQYYIDELRRIKKDYEG